MNEWERMKNVCMMHLRIILVAGSSLSIHSVNTTSDSSHRPLPLCIPSVLLFLPLPQFEAKSSYDHRCIQCVRGRGLSRGTDANRYPHHAFLRSYQIRTIYHYQYYQSTSHSTTLRITNYSPTFVICPCLQTDGAMYSFPRITIPPAAAEKAKALGKEPDVMYCLELLEETGLSCVPGSGFRQVPGTFHIRTTILPPEDKFQDIINRFTSFHKGYMKRYGGSGSSRSRL